MKRREFIALLGGMAAARPRSASAGVRTAPECSAMVGIGT